jgi:hypothetical protein
MAIFSTIRGAFSRKIPAMMETPAGKGGFFLLAALLPPKSPLKIPC